MIILNKICDLNEKLLLQGDKLIEILRENVSKLDSIPANEVSAFIKWSNVRYNDALDIYNDYAVELDMLRMLRDRRVI